MKVVYPAILYAGTESYIIKVPDVQGCVTTGKSLIDAIDNARDALSGCLCVLEDVGESLPEVSKPESINHDEGIVILLDVDLLEYRKATDTKAVRKNVSLPSWMSYLAEKHELNCSQLLQKAIVAELGITL